MVLPQLTTDLSINDIEIITQLAEHFPFAVIVYDLDMTVKHANRYALELLGLSVDDLLTDIRAVDLIPEHEKTHGYERFNRLLHGTQPNSRIITFTAKGGAHVRCQVSSHRVISDGDVCGFIDYGIDITQGREEDDLSLGRNDLLQLVVEESDISGIMVIDDNYRLEYVNDAACRMFGLPRSRMIGSDFRAEIHPNERSRVEDLHEKRQKGIPLPRVYETLIVRADGDVRNLRINSRAVVAHGGTIKTVCQIFDITEEKKHEHELKASERKYRTLIEAIDSGLCVEDENGTTAMVNDALVKMLGYECENDLVGKSISEWVSDEWKDKVIEKISQRREGEFEQYELELLHCSGETVPVVVTASPLFDNNSVYLGTFSIFTDISDLKKAESEVRFLLDILMHDMGNQLQLILAGVGLLKSKSDHISLETASNYITKGTERCLDLIDKIRNVDEAENEPLRPVNLYEVLSVESLLLEQQMGVTPEITDVPQNITVYADSAVNHMLWNLMENAVKHNPYPHKKLMISGRVLGDTMQLRIGDNGPGLGDSRKEALFKANRRYGGVGLHLVSRLARKYGGHLKLQDRIEGRPEKGLEAVIEFRVA